jgi:hypothetical protein
MIEEIYEDFYNDLSTPAKIYLKRMHDWYIKHPDGFLPPTVKLTKNELNSLIFNLSLLTAWCFDDDLPNTVLTTDNIEPLSEN